MEDSEPRNPLLARAATAAVVLLAAISAGTVLATVSRYGPGLNPDSVNYVAAARSLLAGEGVLGPQGDPLVYWPPFLPAVLALLGLTGVGIVRLGGVLNAVAFAAVVAVSGTWLLRGCRRRVMAVLGTVWVAASLPLFHVSCMLWSEPLFILLTVLFLWRMHRYLGSPGSRALLVAALLAAAAALTRYIGFTLAATGCLLILSSRKRALRKRLTDCLLFGAVAAAPLSAWLLRNLALMGTLTGQRHPSNIPLIENASRMGLGLARFFLSAGSAEALPRLVWLAGAAAAALALTCLAARSRRRSGEPAGSGPETILLAFCAVYAAAMLEAATSVAMTPILARYLSPLYVPGVLLVFFALDELAAPGRSEPGGRRTLAGVVVAVAAAATLVWGGVYATRCTKEVNSQMRSGTGGYGSASWHRSETIAFLRRTDLPSPVYSNVPAAVYILAGKVARLTPFESLSASDEPPGPEGLAAFVGACTRGDGATLVWFDSHWQPGLYGLESLRRFVHLEPVARFPDGVVYRATAPETGPSHQDGAPE